MFTLVSSPIIFQPSPCKYTTFGHGPICFLLRPKSLNTDPSSPITASPSSSTSGHGFKASSEASPSANQAHSMESDSTSPFRESYLYPLSSIAKATVSPSLADLFGNFSAKHSQSFLNRS